MLSLWLLARLQGCTNLAHNRPATQSTTGYDGDAGRAVDGNGLDGRWGSASCTHTGTPLHDCPSPPPPDPPFPDCPTPGVHGDGSSETSAEYLHRCLGGPPVPVPPPPPPTPVDMKHRRCGGMEPTWWQVDLGSVQEIRAVQLVNRADCCQDRLVGARIVVSQTADYEDHSGGGVVSCGSVDEAESPIEEQDVIIKVCELGTTGRYVTVVGPNRVYPDADNLYLSLCEVAVYGGCPPLSEEAMGGTLSAAAAAAAESLGENCEISMGTEGPLSFADAERSCNAAGGHLASIHNEQEADYARALIANSPYVAHGEAWIGLNDLHVECLCHGDCFVWTDVRMIATLFPCITSRTAPDLYEVWLS